MASEITDDQIEAMAHRRAWRYKKSSDPHHSDTYTFNRATLLEFVRFDIAALASTTGEAAPVAASCSSIIDTIQPWTMEHLKAYPKAALEILNTRIEQANAAATPVAPSDDEQLVATLIHCSREVSPTAMTGYDLASVLSRAAERIQSFVALSHPAPVAAPAPASEAVAQSITIDFKQATELLEMFGGEPCEITLTAYPEDEHHFEEGFTIAAGLYAQYTECPEEGGNYLGVADHDAIPAGDSVDAPVQQTGAVEVCFDCDIADCRHIRARRAALKGEQHAEPKGSERGNAA